MVDDERHLVKRDEPPQEEVRPVEQAQQHQPAPIEGYGWVATEPTKERIKKAVAEFRAVWPQWSWEWFAQEATAAAARNESTATVVSRITATAGMTATNPALKNFLVSCGILKKGGNRREPPSMLQGVVTEDEEESTLPKL